MTFKIGIIFDTARATEAGGGASLADVDHIHGGDIGRPEIIDALRRIAPECDRSFTISATWDPLRDGSA